MYNRGIDSEDFEYLDNDIITNIDAIKSVVTGLSQIKSIRDLGIDHAIYSQRLQIMLDSCKNSTVKCLITDLPNKVVCELVDTLKLKQLYLSSIGKNIDGDNLIAQSIVKQHTLNKLVIRSVTNNTNEPFYKLINDSTICKLDLVFLDSSEEAFINFCKMVPFKRNFKVVTLREVPVKNIKYITKMFNNSCYVGLLNVHSNVLSDNYSKMIPYFNDIIDYLDNWITVGDIEFYDYTDKPVTNDEFESVRDTIDTKLENAQVTRQIIRCMLVLQKVKNNLVAKLPKCLLMYVVRNFLIIQKID